LQAGQITPEHIRADLAELCQGAHPGRSDDSTRTVFKSAGMALQDLAAATMASDHTILG
jgi:alanine dehydrogenase